MKRALLVAVVGCRSVLGLDEPTTEDIAPLAPVTLVSPGDGVNTSTRPCLLWLPASDGRGYAVELSETPDFAQYWISDPLTITAWCWSTGSSSLHVGAPADLTDGGVYYWRVVTAAIPEGTTPR